LTIGDHEPGAVVVNAAVDRSQAFLVFDEAASMVRASADLRAVAEIVDSRKTIVHRASGSKYCALSADTDTKEGLNIHGTVLDELHAHPNREMFDVLQHAGAARRQPLAIVITTAGVYDPASVGWETHERARQVLEGVSDDWAFFARIWAADPAADWTSPRTWRAANPSFGVTIAEDELRDQCVAAQSSPALENVFKRYRLNFWTRQVERWLPVSTWDASAGHPIADDAPVGSRAFGGVDLASVSDMSALAWLSRCPHDESAVDVRLRCWLPEATLATAKNAPLYEIWQRSGHLTITPGTATDYDVIASAILADAARLGCDSLAIDALFQGLGVARALEDQGVAVYPCRMGFLSLSPLVAELERLILTGKLHHGGHPILRWAVDTVTMKRDAAGNRKPSREQRDTKIDALIATLLALDRWARKSAPVVEESVYLTHGVRTLGEAWGPADG
jgi:phage terminase large subunit-like protein